MLSYFQDKSHVRSALWISPIKTRRDGEERIGGGGGGGVCLCETVDYFLSEKYPMAPLPHPSYPRSIIAAPTSWMWRKILLTLNIIIHMISISVLSLSINFCFISLMHSAPPPLSVRPHQHAGLKFFAHHDRKIGATRINFMWDNYFSHWLFGMPLFHLSTLFTFCPLWKLHTFCETTLTATKTFLGKLSSSYENLKFRDVSNQH